MPETDRAAPASIHKKTPRENQIADKYRCVCVCLCVCVVSHMHWEPILIGTHIIMCTFSTRVRMLTHIPIVCWHIYTHTCWYISLPAAQLIEIYTNADTHKYSMLTHIHIHMLIYQSSCSTTYTYITYGRTATRNTHTHTSWHIYTCWYLIVSAEHPPPEPEHAGGRWFLFLFLL